MIRQFLNDLTPPILKNIYKRTFQKKVYNPEWVTLKNGITIFIDKNIDFYNRLKEGYDSFIYDNLKIELKKQNLVIYDLGAHFGYHSLTFAKKAGSSSKIYAFEPNPKTKERLLMHLNQNPELNQQITVIDKAISNKRGESVFLAFQDLEHGTSSASFLMKDKTKARRNDDVAREIVVKTETIDYLIENKVISPPNIIKIDIEGAESDALEGSLKTLVKFKPILMIEVHSILNMYELIELFKRINYQYKLIQVEKDGRCFLKAFYIEDRQDVST